MPGNRGAVATAPARSSVGHLGESGHVGVKVCGERDERVGGGTRRKPHPIIEEEVPARAQTEPAARARGVNVKCEEPRMRRRPWVRSLRLTSRPRPQALSRPRTARRGSARASARLQAPGMYR